MYKQYATFDTEIQSQAMLNELKGHLFEFLVARLLARHYKVEAAFFERTSHELRTRLHEYELWLRQNHAQCLAQLPVLAQKAQEALIPWLPKQVDQIYVIGKMAGATHQQLWKEADLMLIDHQQGEHPVSLKLSKEGAYVNTKSGGARSFIEHYFSALPHATQAQERFNQQLAASHLQMMYELYQQAGLNFQGQWDQQWEAAGLSELPGQLSAELRAIIHAHYYRVIVVLYEELKHMAQLDPKAFKHCLYPILGLGDPRLIQLTCYHASAQNHEFRHISINHKAQLTRELEQLSWQAFEPGKSSFALNLQNRQLQIRVKPMNRFTAQALKINCSVKTFLLN